MSTDRLPDGARIERAERESWLDLYAAAPGDYVAKSRLKFTRLGGGAALANPSVPIVEFNRIFCIGIEEPATERDLDRAVAWMQEHTSADWSLQAGRGARPDAIHAWLQARNLAKTGNGWAKFTRGSQPARQRETASDLDVRVVDTRDRDRFGAVVQAGFGLPPSCASWFSELVGRPRWRAYLAYDGAVPVASGALFVDGDLGWLGIDATLPEYRRRGAQTSLIARRVADGMAAGLVGFAAETGQPAAGQERQHASYSNYVRAEFVPAYSRPNYRIQKHSSAT